MPSLRSASAAVAVRAMRAAAGLLGLLPLAGGGNPRPGSGGLPEPDETPRIPLVAFGAGTALAHTSAEL